MITVLCCGEPMRAERQDGWQRTKFTCPCGICIPLRDQRLALITERLEANGITQITSAGLQAALRATVSPVRSTP